MVEYNSMVDDHEYHELANLFPLMNEDEFNDLVEDIEKNGLLEAIVLYEDKILDGRNRHEACKKLNIKPQFREFKEWYRDIDPLDFIVAENLKRRHLNTAQRSKVGLEILKIEEQRAKDRKKEIATEIGKVAGRGQKIDSGQSDLLSIKIEEVKKAKGSGSSMENIAKKVKVSPTTLKKAKKIKEVAKEDTEIDELWDKALGGEISIESVVRETEKKQLKKNGMSEKDIISKEKQKELRKIVSPIFLKLPRSYFDDCNDTTIEYAENIAKKIEKFIHKEYHYLF